MRRRSLLVLGLLVNPRVITAQERHETVLISRRLHDVAWIAAGTSVSFSAQELGVRPIAASLFGSVGLAAAKAALHCYWWCRGHGLSATRMLKDGIWESVTAAGPYAVLKLGKRHPWRGVLVAIGYGLVVWRLDRAQWGRP